MLDGGEYITNRSTHYYENVDNDDNKREICTVAKLKFFDVCARFSV